MLFLRVLAVLGIISLNINAAPLFYSGVFTSDGDTFALGIQQNAPGLIQVSSLGYGGLPGLYLPGGFASSLSLYDYSGNQVARDFVGGTLSGGLCSNGATPDPATNFCEDATLSFYASVGSYQLILSVQGNDGPDPLSVGYALLSGQNLPGGPFLDPGDGVTQRTGNWVLSVTLDNAAVVPEPATPLLLAAGCAALALLRRRNRSIAR